MIEHSTVRYRVRYKKHDASKVEEIEVTSYDLINALKVARKLLELAIHPDDERVQRGFSLPAEVRCFKIVSAEEIGP